MPPVLSALLAFVVAFFQSRWAMHLKILALQHQVAVYKHVTVQVVKTGLTPQIAPSDHLREAEKEQLHPAEQLHTLR
jgi:hypothetical protein